ncbi:MAG: Rieske (2Fe-2S) protein [Cellvibrionales bacterium]|jgi:nitrite reductase/ring-hydroxylating ferredoxin subunit|nr:Rieske (2Fe-2S) protein [Cellvibrionales bacterium]TXH49275.1 MAG: Rieske (2Fe-2S) protein [Cellvibrionales bacterium]HRG50762.1 Rieske (2Fe-2S) protein [Pseudomonadales bacterium]
MRFIALEKLHRMHDGYKRAVMVDGRNLLLFQCDDQIHIVDNTCPHAGAALDRGSIRSGQLICPWHGIAFDVRTGQAATCGLQLVKYTPAFEQQSVGILVD